MYVLTIPDRLHSVEYHVQKQVNRGSACVFISCTSHSFTRLICRTPNSCAVIKLKHTKPDGCPGSLRRNVVIRTGPTDGDTTHSMFFTLFAG